MRSEQSAAAPRSWLAWLGALLLLGSAAVPPPSAAGEPSSRHASGLSLDAIFVIDNSGSMKANDPGFVTHRVVKDFARQLPRDSRLGIVLFDDGARLIEPLSRATGPQAVRRWTAAMAMVDFRGQLTHSPAGVERALYELETRGRDDADKVIVFITDGIVDTGDRQRDVEKKRWLTTDLAQQARRAGVRIFGIAFTEQADVELIQALALATDGAYYRVDEAGDIPQILARIGRSIEAPRRHAATPPGPPAGPDTQPSDTPPVSSAPVARTPGAVWLSLAVFAVLLVLSTPLLQRRRRRRHSAVAAPAPIFAPEPSPPPRRSSRQPVARLVDVANVSANGLLPLSLDRQRSSIGRDSSNDIVIRRDTISSFHATIDYVDGYFYLEDHRSTNGSYLNGKALRENQPVQLKSGDRLDFSVFEFRFIIPDHEPRGRTVVLDGSSLVSPPDVVGAAVELSSAEPEAEPETGQRDHAAAFDECLATHLKKMSGLGDEHRKFVSESFAPELIDVLSRRARDLIECCREEGGGQMAELSKAAVHYTLCVLPERMDDAAAWFTREHGGYAKLLVELLDSWASGDRECRTLCVISYGMVDEPWISITVVPARDDSDTVEVMSFEFLSPEERRRALSLDIVEVGRSG